LRWKESEANFGHSKQRTLHPFASYAQKAHAPIDQVIAVLELLLTEITSQNCLGMTMRFKDSSLSEIYSYFE
jgi:hypothetical protein